MRLYVTIPPKNVTTNPINQATLICDFPPEPRPNPIATPPPSVVSLGIPRKDNCAIQINHVNRFEQLMKGGKANPIPVKIPHNRIWPLICASSGLTIKPFVHAGGLNSFDFSFRCFSSNKSSSKSFLNKFNTCQQIIDEMEQSEMSENRNRLNMCNETKFKTI